MSAIQVLHCPTAVAGNAPALARAEREVGLKSWSVMFFKNPFGYEADEVLSEGSAQRLTLEFKRWKLLRRALREFEIIHFNFGQSLAPQRAPLSRNPKKKFQGLAKRLYNLYAAPLELLDLRLLKRAGKGIVVTYQGNDARQGDFCLSNFEITAAREIGPPYYTPSSDKEKRERIAEFARYADRIYALNPDILHVLPPHSKFLPYTSVDLRRWRPGTNGPITSNGVPVVLHAPTNREMKGTRFIIDAVSRLRAEGIKFEFLLVEGIKRTQARKLYERADLLVDQLLIGWYGGLAVELMALGKPVVCYIREDDLKFIPSEMRNELPIINATPATVYDVLREHLTGGRSRLAEIGKRSRAYVERWHDPLKIAARLKAEYESILTSRGEKIRG